MIDLHNEFQTFNIPKEKKSLKGLDALVNAFIGLIYKRLIIPSFLRIKARKVHIESLVLQGISDEELDKKLEYYRKCIRFGKASKKQRDNALSCIAEASFRTLGLRPFSVQLMGVMAQQKGIVIQMLPGEGKTITAAISGVMAAWSGKPCHIVTSNDYLAERDAIDMRLFYERCKLRSGYVVSMMEENERIANYKANVVYATSKELLADFLRDAMKSKILNFDAHLVKKLTFNSQEKVMSGLHTAIVDEADSVLADEAVTPLIISVSKKNEVLKQATYHAKDVIGFLEENEDFILKKELKQVDITYLGEEKILSKKEGFPPAWRQKTRSIFLIQQALIAKNFYHNRVDYIINEEGKIVLVDEKTGRMMEGHSWGEGLQQAVEAKEDIEVSDATETHMKMSFQRFFRLYSKLSGMSGTLQHLEDVFWQLYRLPTMKIPKRVSNTYKILPPKVYSTRDKKIEAIIENIKDINQIGRPVLVGTKDIKECEEMAELLNKKGYTCTVLNALKYEDEARIVYEAGQKNQITIATNMAGRGTDIKINDEVNELGGLHVIATQKFTSKRVDLQLYGRTARQGQNGTVQQIFSMEDELFEKFLRYGIFKMVAKRVENPLMKKVFMILFDLVQIFMERNATRYRKGILERDFSTNEMLSFGSI